MKRLWSWMLEQYGRQFESSYGLAHGEAYQKWAADLSEFSPQQIRNGLDTLRAEGSDYPPNLIKFCRLCRTAKPAYYQPVNLAALPRPDVKKDPRTQAARDKHFDAVKKLYGA